MLSYAEFVRVIPVSLSCHGSFGAENVGTSYITTNLRPSLHQGHTGSDNTFDLRRGAAALTFNVSLDQRFHSGHNMLT